MLVAAPTGEREVDRANILTTRRNFAHRVHAAGLILGCCETTSVAREYFVRLSSDPEAQDVLRALYRDRVGPAFRAADDRFRRAFGEQLRTVPVEGRAIGYGYREAPELIEPHLRRFLDDVGRREGR